MQLCKLLSTQRSNLSFHLLQVISLPIFPRIKRVDWMNAIRVWSLPHSHEIGEQSRETWSNREVFGWQGEKTHIAWNCKETGTSRLFKSSSQQDEGTQRTLCLPSQELHVCIVCIEISKLYWNPNTNTIQDCLYSDAIFSIGLYSCISMYNACINPYLYIFVCIVSVLINCSYWLVLHVFYCIDMYCMYCIYCMYCMYWIVFVCIDCIACIVCFVCIALYFYVFMCISMYGLYRMFCMYCMYCLVFSCIVCIACIACIAGMCVYWYVLFVLHVLYVFNVLPCIGMYSLYCLYCIYCMYSYVLIVLLVFWLYCLYGAQCHVFAFIIIYLHVLICII